MSESSDLETGFVFRVHPAIGVARVGNSPEHYLAPETGAGVPTAGPGSLVGGLPIRPGTEDETITSADLRDKYGQMKRQAARFRVFAYPPDTGENPSFPRGDGVEIRIGSTLGGRQISDIVWTVHLANKKANAHMIDDNLGLAVYEPANAAQLQLRNAAVGPDPDNAARLRQLVIDPGPRAVRGARSEEVAFDKQTPASYWSPGAGIVPARAYPASFPEYSFPGMYTPAGDIDTLGSVQTDEYGRLVLLPGYGRSCARLQPDGTPYPLVGDLNSDGWFDDTADGPVSAVLIFDDGTTAPVHGAWAICTDPGFAPQIRNVVSLWDDVYDTWVRHLDLVPELFGSRFRDGYRPAFEEIEPLFRAVAQQRWTANLPQGAIAAHDAVGRIGPGSDPQKTVMAGLAYVRDPDNASQNQVGAPFMPLSLGDAGDAFLSVTRTQFFLLQQWERGRAHPGPGVPPGPGERLDMVTLANCLGGRFVPGIEMTFVVRDPWFWEQDWASLGSGPFRLRAQALDYEKAQSVKPFLTVGYVPRHPGPDGLLPARLEPGDATKFMALPWQTDYNSCATHNTRPNPTDSTTLYWSWPAQRPVHVHRAEESVISGGTHLGPWVYSVRGPGTESGNLADAGRYQILLDAVKNWHHIGFVIQGTAIRASLDLSAEHYLEVMSQYDTPEIIPWPMNASALGTPAGPGPVASPAAPVQETAATVPLPRAPLGSGHPADPVPS